MLLTREPKRQVRVRRGRLSIAVDFPNEATMTIERVGDTLVVFPRGKASPALKAMLAFRREADAAGVTLQELLQGLEEEGERYTKEVYGTP